MARGAPCRVLKQETCTWCVPVRVGCPAATDSDGLAVPQTRSKSNEQAADAAMTMAT